MDISVEERVDNGIKILDGLGPSDWRNDIDINALDLESIYACPLAQIFGGFVRGCNILGISVNDDASLYGFERDFDISDPVADYHALTTEWLRRLS